MSQTSESEAKATKAKAKAKAKANNILFLHKNIFMFKIPYLDSVKYISKINKTKK